jgi:hypothetical protein
VTNSTCRGRASSRVFALGAVSFMAILFAGAGALAQKTIDTPPTDTSVQSSPLRPAPKAPVNDSSMLASPIPESKPSGVFLSPHTAIPIALNEAIDSGKLKNGQTVHARLTAAVSAHGKTLPAGTPVDVTVVATVPAGKLNAEGEFSLQLESIGGIHAYTDTQTFRGKPGARDVADAAPSLGTDAGLPGGAPLTFHVLPPPVEATSPPPNVPNPPGAVNGTAVGGPPPPGSSPRLAAEENRGEIGPNGSVSNSGNSQSATPAPQVVTPSNTTSHPIAGTQPH